MLYRFELEVSDVDRGIYETFKLRTALHPSESIPYLLTRVLAYALSFQEGLDFSPSGLGDPDAPALLAKNSHGQIEIWIEIGNPSSRKLHKASKTSSQVVVYTYKNPNLLIEEMNSNEIHKVKDIRVYAFHSQFLEQLEKILEKNNHWSVLIQQGQIDINGNDFAIQTEIVKVQ